MRRTPPHAPIAATDVYVYRGVHADHPEIQSARLGIVNPDNIEGQVTPAEHNAGGREADSPYTSWTYSRDYAEKRANDRGAGVLLRLRMTPAPSNAKWRWQESPDRFDEDEVLLFGIRMDAEVIK